MGEEMKRQVIWHENLAIVTKHNLEFDQGIHTHELGMNKFADLSLEEWKAMMLMPTERGVQAHICDSTFVQKENVLKKHVDWVKKGYVTPIKDQGQCGSCWAFSTTGSIEGQHFAKTGNLTSLAEAVQKIGPISVAVDAGHSSFQLYKKGIYSEKLCSSTKPDHGVLAVGFGEDSNGDAYWIIKNSWGTVWGMEGFMHMARNKGNMCGVSTQASYPTV